MRITTDDRSMTGFFSLLFLAVVVSLQVGCRKSTIEPPPVVTDTTPPDHQYIRAVITYFLDPDTKQPLDRPAKVVISDYPEISKLAAFFPGMGDGKTSTTPATWTTFASIQFVVGREYSVSVRVDPQFQAWTEEGDPGSGEWMLKPEFGEYFVGLLKKK